MPGWQRLPADRPGVDDHGGEVSVAVPQRSVQEVWYVLAGSGQMWRRPYEREETITLRPAGCLTIPLGTTFQFRAEAASLSVVALTAPL
ncbi:hypothetical protein ABZ863_06875 [Saccharomonospora sp. NPDC046836]|uniref:hypothetical protein n=1 Tax=Saccharomonospora sp. NPDC046836 TaxID=3156921 RepID=UPI0033F3CBA6